MGVSKRNFLQAAGIVAALFTPSICQIAVHKAEDPIENANDFIRRYAGRHEVTTDPNSNLLQKIGLWVELNVIYENREPHIPTALQKILKREFEKHGLHVTRTDSGSGLWVRDRTEAEQTPRERGTLRVYTGLHLEWEARRRRNLLSPEKPLSEELKNVAIAEDLILRQIICFGIHTHGQNPTGMAQKVDRIYNQILENAQAAIALRADPSQTLAMQPR